MCCDKGAGNLLEMVEEFKPQSIYLSYNILNLGPELNSLGLIVSENFPAN